VTERMIERDGVRLCTESFGDPGDPPVVLVMGMSASMLWWDEGFCRMLAAGGRFVVRYDHRDTGRSQTDEPGRPTYTGMDLVGDIARVLDGRGIGAAHVVGTSMGGALAQVLALDHPDRVASLVLMDTSPAGPGDGLAPPADDYARFLSDVEVDWADQGSVIAFTVANARALIGERRPFGGATVRALVERDAARSDRPESAHNHALVEGGDPWRHRLGEIAAPTLVIHGTDDPLFPIEHGRALAAEIPGARLLALEGAGHLLAPADHETVARAILDHTAAAAALSGS
jgi:pimeloyl-ACP methyl ester carboxylesterase